MSYSHGYHFWLFLTHIIMYYFQAKYDNKNSVQTTKTVKETKSPSNSFVQLVLLSTDLKVCQSLTHSALISNTFSIKYFLCAYIRSVLSFSLIYSTFYQTLQQYHPEHEYKQLFHSRLKRHILLFILFVCIL